MNRIFERFRKKVLLLWSDLREDWKHFVLLFKREPYPTLLSEDLKRRYRLLTRLHIIDEERKKQIDQRLVMRYSRLITRLNFEEERLHAIVTSLYRTIMLVFILLVGKLYQMTGTTLVRDIDPFPTTFIGYISEFGSVVVFLLLYSLFIFILARSVKFARLLILYVVALSLSIFYLSLPFTSYKVYAFGLVGFHTIILTAVVINRLITQRYERFFFDKTPESIIVFNILFVLHKLDEGSLKSFYSKPMFVTRLEYAALYMEKYIYKVLKTSDEETNQWIMERTRQIASGIRDKKKWVYTPKPDTAQYLAESLADFLIHFLRNEWDSLERVETPKVPQKRSWIMQSAAIARSLIFGLLPISILLLFQETSIVPVPFSDSMIGIAVIWAIVSLLWLDPSAKDKIGALKDATGILPSKS